MNTERELEICKWLDVTETDLTIKVGSYFGLIRLLDDFHNDQLKKLGMGEHFSAEQIVDELEDAVDIEVAIRYYKRKMNKVEPSNVLNNE